MPAPTIEVQELPERWAEIIPQVAAGMEVIVTEGNVPCAKLVALPKPQRIAGLHPGVMQASDDFDAPLPDEFWLGRS